MATRTGPFEIQKVDSGNLSARDTLVLESNNPMGVHTSELASRKANRRRNCLHVVTSQAPETASPLNSTSRPDSDHPNLMRKFECSHYETCLSLAAALNWSSFTCCNCSGDIDKKLMWRAHQQIRQDKELAKLCNLPPLRSCESKDKPVKQQTATS